MIELLFFGQLTDITGSSCLTFEAVEDTDMLVSKLHEKFPALSQSKYRIAVNNKMISNNTKITPGSSIAFMPPFSGG